MPEHFNPSDPDYMAWLTEQSKSANKKVDDLKNKQDYGPWITPDWLNSFSISPSPYKTFQYRVNLKGGTIEVRGSLNVTSASTGDAAFEVIEVLKQDHDFTIIRDVYDSGQLVQARFLFDHDTGLVTVEWPIGGSSSAGIQSWPTMYEIELHKRSVLGMVDYTDYLAPVGDHSDNFQFLWDPVNLPPHGCNLINSEANQGWFYGAGDDIGPYNRFAAFMGYFQLGPHNSIWQLDVIGSRGPDHGRLEAWWATVANPDDFYNQMFNPFFHPADSVPVQYAGPVTPVTTWNRPYIDFYNASYSQNRLFLGRMIFGIGGADGDQLTAFTTPPTETVPLADGGSGVWALILKITDKHASSTDYRMGIQAITLSRQDSEAYS